MFNCTCCGTEIKSPYFYNGGVYGWTCIKKVNPSEKRNKPKTKCFEVVVHKTIIEDGWTRGKAYISINGVKSIVSAYLTESGIEIGNFKKYDDKWWALV